VKAWSNIRVRTLVGLLSTALVATAALTVPTPAAAVSSSKLITSLTYTTPSTKMQLRNAGNTANATFSSGTGTDAAGTDEYTIKLYHSAISLIPVVSAKATWECDVTSDGVAVDADCSTSDLVPGDEAVIVVTVEAEDGTTNEYTFNVIAYDTRATLDDLVLDVGTLTPAFSSAVTGYTAITASSTIDIDPDPTSAAATVVCKKGSSTYDNCDGALAVGSNSITITVTAEDGVTKRNYTVAVTRVADTNAEIESISLSHGGLLTASSTHTSFTRTRFSSSVVAYDLTSNDKDVNITVDLKHEDATFDCEVVDLGSSVNQLGEVDGAQCEFDITGANDDTDHRITITVHPDTAGTDKVYTFTVRLSATVVSNEDPTLTPLGATLRVGSSVTFDPVGAAVINDFSNATRVMYQWYLCANTVAAAVEDASTVPAHCVAKSTAIGARYTAVASDAGKHLIGALIGQPGSVLSYSASKEIVGAPGLANAATPPAPEEAGLVGAEIETEIALENIAEADFTGITDVATEVDFQWYRCSSASATPTVGLAVTVPSTCKKILGATSDAYEPTTNEDPLLDDSGKFLRARLILSPPGRAEYMILTRTTNKVFGPAINTGGVTTPSAPTLTSTAPTKILTAGNGTWSGNPAGDTTDAGNFSYQWYYCHAPVSSASNIDPTTRLMRGTFDPRCEIIAGESAKTLTVTTEWCGKFLMYGVTFTNTDFRGKGGTSLMRYSASSSNIVTGAACTE